MNRNIYGKYPVIYFFNEKAVNTTTLIPSSEVSLTMQYIVTFTKDVTMLQGGKMLLTM